MSQSDGSKQGWRYDEQADSVSANRTERRDAIGETLLCIWTMLTAGMGSVPMDVSLELLWGNSHHKEHILGSGFGVVIGKHHT